MGPIRARSKETILAEARASQAAARTRRRSAGEREPWHSPEAGVRRGAAIGRRNREAMEWGAAHPGPPPDPADFAPIREGLAGVSIASVAVATGLSKTYSSDVRLGRCVPHPRHWRALARLAGVACPFETGSASFGVSWWREVVVPALSAVSTKRISEVTGLSGASASKVRRGLQTPAPRHWIALAEVAGIKLTT